MTLCVAALENVAVQVATPALSVTAEHPEIDALPSLNVTEPVAALGETVAVSVTLWPT